MNEGRGKNMYFDSRNRQLLYYYKILSEIKGANQRIIILKVKQGL